MLFSVGGLFALYEAWHKLHDPHAIDSWQWVPVLVLVVAIGLESYSFRTAIVESNRVRGKSSWKEFVRRAKAPELPVVLLEDLGAPGRAGFRAVRRVYDADHPQRRLGRGRYGVIGFLLVAIAVILAVETKSLLLGEGAAPPSSRRSPRCLRSRAGSST